MTAHTTGPWTGFLDERDGHAAWLIGPASARPIVAEVAADKEAGLTGATVEANARLIAAGPELLSELKRAAALLEDADHEWFGSNGSDNSAAFQKMMAPIRAAIAKATGGEP